MQDLTSKLTIIVQKYMRNPAAVVGLGTTLGDLEIDTLDFPMICLDVEDVFDVQISYDDEIEEFTTFGALAICVASRLETKALQPTARLSVPRSKGSWMSTGADRRR